MVDGCDGMDSFTIPDGHVQVLLPAKQRRRRYTKFVAPIPLLWLYRAGSLPGHALHVAFEIRYLTGVANESTVKLSLKKLKVKIRTSQITLARGKAELERAGLVSVTRRSGSSALVTINEITEDLVEALNVSE
jgi:hypothetical protein